MAKENPALAIAHGRTREAPTSTEQRESLFTNGEGYNLVNKLFKETNDRQISKQTANLIHRMRSEYAAFEKEEQTEQTLKEAEERWGKFLVYIANQEASEDTVAAYASILEQCGAYIRLIEEKQEKLVETAKDTKKDTPIATKANGGVESTPGMEDKNSQEAINPWSEFGTTSGTSKEILAKLSAVKAKLGIKDEIEAGERKEENDIAQPDTVTPAALVELLTTFGQTSPKTKGEAPKHSPKKPEVRAREKIDTKPKTSETETSESTNDYIYNLVTEVSQGMTQEAFKKKQGGLREKFMTEIRLLEEEYRNAPNTKKEASRLEFDILAEFIETQIIRLKTLGNGEKKVQESFINTLENCIATVTAHKPKAIVSKKTKKESISNETLGDYVSNLVDDIVNDREITDPEDKRRRIGQSFTNKITSLENIHVSNQKDSLKKFDSLIAFTSGKINRLTSLGQNKSEAKDLTRTLTNCLTMVKQHRQEMVEKNTEQVEEKTERHETTYSLDSISGIKTFLEQVLTDKEFLIDGDIRNDIMDEIEDTFNKEVSKAKEGTEKEIAEFRQNIFKLLDTIHDNFGYKTKTINNKTIDTVGGKIHGQKNSDGKIGLLEDINSICIEALKYTHKEKEAEVQNHLEVSQTDQANISDRHKRSQGNDGEFDRTEATAVTTTNETTVESPATSTPEEMVALLIDESSDELHISDEIKKDKLFEAWLHRIAERNNKERYNAPTYINPKTIEDWHQEYKASANQILTIKGLLTDKTAFENVFSSFETEEKKDFARKNMGQQLEWELVYDPENAKKKIESILLAHKETIEQNEKAKKLEEKQKEIMRALTNQGGERIPGEVAFDIMYGNETFARTAKVHDLSRFLTDMSQNYEYYSNADKDSNHVSHMRKMFNRYEDSRRNNTPDKHELDKLSWYKKAKLAIGRKLSFNSKLEDYEDLRSFETIMETMKNLGLVPSANTPKNQSSENMKVVMSGINSAVKTMSAEGNKGMTFEDAVQVLNLSDEQKERIKTLYRTYIDNRGRHTFFQEQAKQSEASKKILRSIDTSIQNAKTKQSEAHMKMESALFDIDQYNFEYFQLAIEQEFALDSLTKLSENLRKNKNSLKALEDIESKLGRIDSDMSHEVELAHKRISLELSQAYVTATTKNEKGFVLAPSSIKHYERILADDKITRKKKEEYLNAVIKLLRDSLAIKKGTLEQIEIKRFITNFEKKLSNLGK
jgi:hypothetical protein